jgi:serine/threonine protein kinase
MSERLFGNKSAEAVDLIQNMITPTPETRITAESALNHPWFANYITPQDRSVSAATVSVPSNYALFDAMVERFARRKTTGYVDIQLVTPSVNLGETFGHEKLMQVA